MSTLPPPPPLENYGQSYGSPVGLTPYATWAQRVGGALMDAVPGIVLSIIGLAGSALNAICSILSLMFFAWNTCYRQGKTGQSIGKQVLGIKLIKEETGQPVGGWYSFGRQVTHILDALPILLGYLWPLWDSKKQTFADKVLSTVVVSAK